MIANVLNRTDFAGIVNYAHNDKDKKKRATLLAHEGVCVTDNKTIARSFYLQASMRPGRKSPVKHISLSFSPRDLERVPDNEEGDALMAEIAKEWLRCMGIVNTQYIIARHHDTRHPHCHVVYNIVDNDGNVISDSNERYRSTRICRALTEEYGLYIARKNSKEQNLDRLRPVQLKRAQLRIDALDALASSQSWWDFNKQLAMRGIKLETKCGKTSDDITGLSYHRDDMHVAASRLDSALTVRKLYKTIGYDTIALAFMPQVPTTECGGSITNNRGWRDEDDEKPKRTQTQAQTVTQPAAPKQSAQPKYNPIKFRRR